MATKDNEYKSLYWQILVYLANRPTLAKYQDSIRLVLILSFISIDVHGDQTTIPFTHNSEDKSRMRQARDVKDKNYKLLLVNRLQQIVTGYSTSLDEVYHEESNMADAKDEVCTWGNRKFCDIPKAYINSTTNVQSHEDCGKLCDYIERNCLGREFEFTTPFGKRKVVYSDYVASSKSLKFLEDYITNNVLNCYGNTHTTTTVTSLQTTLYRHEARTIIRNAVNASEHDAVIFAGSGTTAAVHKFIHALKIKTAPIVFVGPFEHHSNILPWKEIGSEIVWIREARDRNVDVDHLEEMLKLHSKDDQQLIGCFSAASNITGILTDTNKVSACLHRYGALAVWDYATAGPYTEINMNPVVTSEDSSLVYKDAVFLSPHKFVGGVGTPGILIAKKNLFQNTVPSNCGGGSVFFVTHNSHRYLKEIEMREEGGTPAIVESIRAGLVFQLKEAVGHEYIMKIENDFLKLANDVFSRCSKLIILGNYDTPRLPVFSFLIKHEESGLFLHHNFVSSLLNDLFGIQSRGGCACAGPYAQDLLGIDQKLANEIESALLEDSRLDRVHLRRYGEYSERELVRPGFTRINLPYFMKKEEALFILESIVLVAEHGWKLLPKYTFNPETGEWRHRQHQIFKDRKWLGSISYSSGEMKYPENVTTITENENNAPNYQECLATAMEIFKKAAVVKGQNTPNDQSLLLGDAERLRWFLLPSEAYAFLREETRHGYPKIPPFSPRRRCYHGEMGASNNIPKHIDEVLENTECERENCSDCKNVVDIYKGKHDKERVKSEESNLTPENSACNSLVNNREILESRHDDKDVSDSTENEKTEHCFHNQQVKFHNPPRHVFNLTVKAIEEFNMIEDGDRLLVCVSGGKDSLSMLHTLHQYQFYAKTKGVDFHIGAATVDPGSAAYDPSPLKSYMKELGIEYFYEVQGIIKQASELAACESICSFCSRMKRGRLYACARRHGYNVLAIGQHLDDIAESFLMSVFHNGLLRTMKANYFVSENDLRVIRPMTYVREKDLRDFAEKFKLPVITENCPACFEAPKERHRVKQLLANQEILFPNLFKSIQSAMKPLLARKRTRLESKESSVDELSFLCR